MILNRFQHKLTKMLKCLFLWYLTDVVERHFLFGSVKETTE